MGDSASSGENKKAPSLLNTKDFHPVQNIVNFILMIVVSFPWIFAVYQASQCDPATAYSATGPLLQDRYCHAVLDSPLWSLNLLFFWLISILFWVLSIVQSSTWVCSPSFFLFFFLFFLLLFILPLRGEAFSISLMSRSFFPFSNFFS